MDSSENDWRAKASVRCSHKLDNHRICELLLLSTIRNLSGMKATYGLIYVGLSIMTEICKNALRVSLNRVHYRTSSVESPGRCVGQNW